MNTNEFIVKICVFIISVVSALISVYLIPYLKSKGYYDEFHVFESFVIDIVRSANQIYTKEEWKLKKEYAMKLVTEYVNEHSRLGLKEDQIDAIIEGIVKEIKINDGIEYPFSAGFNSDNLDFVRGGNVQ